MAKFLLEDIFKIPFLGVVLAGEVKSGFLMPGMKTTIKGKILKIKAIETAHKSVERAEEGSKVGILLDTKDSKLFEGLVNKEIEFL